MAITYGMSVKEFWEDDPDLFWAYRFSYFTGVKVEQEIFNQNAWLQGMYFYEAISIALCNAFSNQRVEYSKQPYGVDVDEKKQYKEMQLELVSKITKRVTQLQALKGKNESGATNKGNTEGGEKISE